MGTTWEVKIADAPPPRPAGELQRGIIAILDGIDVSMSTYRPDSAVSTLNNAPAGEWVTPPEDLYSILLSADLFSKLTEGRFDVTVGPIVNLWGFGPDRRPRRVPTDAELEAARARAGYQKLEFDLTTKRVRKQAPGVFIDLNAIAPGYAVDRITAFLVRAGCANFLVELGGEVHARGPGPGNRGWRIGIERPVTGERTVQRIIPLRDAGLSSSGDYRDHFEQGGIRYGHTIDPATGRPVSHDLAAVTVIDVNTMSADALATALMVMGPGAGLAFAEQRDTAALFIIRGGSGFDEVMSKRMKEILAK